VVRFSLLVVRGAGSWQGTSDGGRWTIAQDSVVGAGGVRDVGGAVARHVAVDATIAGASAEALGDGEAATRGALAVALQASRAVKLDALLRLDALMRVVAGNTAELP